jgi:hypothetical protein
METSMAISAVCGALRILIGGLIGLRLLVLAARTRGIQELCVAISLSLLAFVTIPLFAYSGLGRSPVGEVKLIAAAFALFCLVVGFGAHYTFTWTTFRPGVTWAAVLTVIATSLLAIASVGIIAKLATSPPELLSHVAALQWIAALWLTLLGCYLWTSAESLLEYTRARRRVALGLTDPAVSNRLLLWGVANAVQLFVNSASIVLQMEGITPTNHMLGTLLIGSSGLFAAVLMYLAFLPPASYLRFVRRQPQSA